MKLHRYIDHDSQMTPIDFLVTLSKVKVTMTRTIWKCAVSPTGDKLYISNWDHKKLLTLARDGTLLAIFIDPELAYPLGVHATPAGQVLVCGYWSNTVLQVDCVEMKKLATLATEKDGVLAPWTNSKDRSPRSPVNTYITDLGMSKVNRTIATDT
ncbi:hypothetical protein DPMN_171685 [Dreissena polymorpha]|uniref:Uncharacterized protein n=1 Tax=Dreissena polymorpha TaxID=45954 RepID=A0A9D4E1L7_DREPO|nr:hypothetical protein DPMN_171685 [Dreissena polymorpha]